MTDLKISQLGAAATPLTGAELIELVQGGVNVQGTTAEIAALAPPSAFGNPNNPFAVSNGSQVRWATMTINPSSGAFTTGLASSGNGVGWNPVSGSTGGLATHSPNTGGATIYASTGFITQATGSGSTGQASEVLGSIFNGEMAVTRALSGGFPICGGQIVYYGGLDTVASAMRFFWGFGPLGAVISSGDPSAFLSTIGFGKDAGDTNVQFMYNNSAGTATKVDTGFAPSAITQHMLKVVISIDVVGNVTATLQDLETGGVGTHTFTVATATAKLPANGVSMQPLFYIDTGTQTAAVKHAYHSIFVTSSFFS